MADVTTTPTVVADASAPAAMLATRGARRGGILTAIRRRWPLTLGLVVVALLLLSAIAAPLLAPRNPDLQNIGQRLRPPSAASPFGTDQ